MEMKRESKADLHIHSKYSDRPSEWFLRRIGAPESFVEPLEIYKACKDRGMDYVTITDHNSIRGALEIAHLPGTFLSAEITTYFPEDNCKIHLVVSSITESWFDEIQELRGNIYHLQKYLYARRIIHFVAHPLYRINDRLTLEHLEKLLLLFKGFEEINGSRYQRSHLLLENILQNLSPQKMEEMSNRHNLSPVGKEPWIKFRMGGSDDHSGLFTASAHTVTPPSTTLVDFLEHLRAGRCRPDGVGGSSVRLAHSIYRIAYGYYHNVFLQNGSRKNVLRQFFQTIYPPPGKKTTSKKIISFTFGRLTRRYKKARMSEMERAIAEEFASIMETAREGEKQEEDNDGPDEHHHYFRNACNISQKLGYSFFQRFCESIQKGRLIESLQSLASLGPVLLGIAPYLTAFKAQHKDESFLKEVAGSFTGPDAYSMKSGRKAWITDTFEDLNGVSHTIDLMASTARKMGRDITVVTCLKETPLAEYPLKNFKPVGIFRLPEYEYQKIVFPPFLELLHYLESMDFDEIIISTPGPLGLCGLAAARLLHIKVSGIYHTDFPHYVKELTEDESLEEPAWRYMRWFYGGMDTIYLPSRYYMKVLSEHGFDSERLELLPKGVDLELFNPQKRNPNFPDGCGSEDKFKYIYVGRISREKNLEVMLEAFLFLAGDDNSSLLFVVGDGPALKDLRKMYQGEKVIFTGYLRGAALAEAFASADVFVFPSMTDTFGNVILEAHASGLPAIVTDKGGPPEIVREYSSGIIVEDGSAAGFAEAMTRIRSDRDLYDKLKEGALAKAEESRWETAVDIICPKILDSDSENAPVFNVRHPSPRVAEPSFTIK
jgi:glycosyltransferase involved in cell wall biosynthesis